VQKDPGNWLLSFVVELEHAGKPHVPDIEFQWKNPAKPTHQANNNKKVKNLRVLRLFECGKTLVLSF
jgi:hypothetical protein